MQITSKTTKSMIILCTILALVPIAVAAARTKLIMTHNNHAIAIRINGDNIPIAEDSNRKVSYFIPHELSQHIVRADELRLMADASTSEILTFMLLSRELSRPGGIGIGYCGAGHEDHLLLVQVASQRLILRDQLMIQSCLRNISIFIDSGGDNPSDGIKKESDQSFTYRLVDDDVDRRRKIYIKDGRFKVEMQ